MPLPMFKKQKKKKQKVIAIAAGKGGVGKSTVAVNLALALSRLGQKVGILDADVYGPSIRKMLPEERPPSQQGNQLIPAICSNGIKMISMAYFRKEREAAAIRAPIANNIILQFLQNIDWGELDYLLIDFPPGTGDIQLTLSQRASLVGAVIVTTPQEVALLDVRKAMDLFEQVKVPLIGIVENMSYYQAENAEGRTYIFGKGGGKKLAQSSGLPFLGEIPIDPEICRCGDHGEPLIPLEKKLKTAGGEAFMLLAEVFMDQVNALEELSEGIMQNFVLKWKEIPENAPSN